MVKSGSNDDHNDYDNATSGDGKRRVCFENDVDGGGSIRNGYKSESNAMTYFEGDTEVSVRTFTVCITVSMLTGYAFLYDTRDFLTVDEITFT